MSDYGNRAVGRSSPHPKKSELFQKICDQLRHEESDWSEILLWLSRHSNFEIIEAANFCGRKGKKALHVACEAGAPMGVIEILVKAAPSSIEWPDDSGWLPLHYATHHKVSDEVLQYLIDKFPDALKIQDKNGRNPVHYAVGDHNKEVSFGPSLFSSMLQNGAAKMADKKGMVCLHFACAYGASPEILERLIAANPKALTATDQKGLTPLHFAIGNLKSKNCPKAVELILKYYPRVVNMDFEHKQHPIFFLASNAKKLKDIEEHRQNAIRCLQAYLDRNPAPNTNFFAAMQSLPKWLLDEATVHHNVQTHLNNRISSRFPTAIMMLDFYALLCVIASFTYAVIESIDRRNNDKLESGVNSSILAPLYLSAIYFTLREMIQVLSFIHLGLFSVWYKRGTNWMEILMIVLVLFWAIVLSQGIMATNTFQTCAALTIFFFWLNCLNFLRGLLVEFAVFVSGVIHVVKRLGPFLLALAIILVAFMQMFNFSFQETDYCNGYDGELSFVDKCDPESAEPYRFCAGGRSLLNVYTMLLGEVDESDFETSKFATFLFVVFVFLVVLLLATVLIAIVTDAYSVIRKERAAIVFWSNRLDFIVEMDVIKTVIWKDSDVKDSSIESQSMATLIWGYILDIFDKDTSFVDEMKNWPLSFLLLQIIRVLIVLFVIPIWIGFGFIFVGTIWPAQWRQMILHQSISAHNNSALEKMQYHHKEIQSLKHDVLSFQRDIVEQIKDQQEVTSALVAEVEIMKRQTLLEISEIRNVLQTLYDSQMKPERSPGEKDRYIHV